MDNKNNIFADTSSRLVFMKKKTKSIQADKLTGFSMVYGIFYKMQIEISRRKKSVIEVNTFV